MNKRSSFERKPVHIIRYLRLRIAIILFLIGSISLYAQKSVSVQNQTIREALKVIEEKYDYTFFYNAQFAELQKNVSFTVTSESVDDVLAVLLKDTQLSYEKRNNQIILVPSSQAPQQSGKVTGTITDENGIPVIGANVIVKGTTNGTVTDINGNYSIEVPSDGMLQISYIGYLRQDILVNNRSAINISLHEDTQNLDEIVVVGYGTQTRREITGSITSITSKDFNQGLNKDAAGMMQGKVAGLVVNNGSGDVTKDANIQLRGISTLQNDKGPFIVIDNVPGADLSTVSPHDIESISILKDASSAAIYGSRSAGGVILITTKRGSASQPRVNYTGAVGISTLANKPNLLTASQWRDYTAKNYGAEAAEFDLGANTDWFDEITRTGFQQDHSVSLSGGGQSHNYRGSFSYMQRDGLARDNELNRYNMRFQFAQYALDNRLKIDLTGVATITNNKPTYERNFLLAYNMIPVRPVKMDDGSWFDTREYDQGNPVRNQDENTLENKINNFYGTANISYTIFDGLEIKAMFAKSRNTLDYSQYYSMESEAGYQDGGSALRKSNISDKDLMEWTANYSGQFGGHKLNVLAGYSWEQNEFAEHEGRTRGYVTNMLGANDLASGQNVRTGDVKSSKNRYRLISFYARANYSYKERYMLTATLRDDGSSKFGENHKWGLFPSVSAGWNITQEEFMQGVKWLNELKLSVGYGVTGNQEGLNPYKTRELYESSGVYYDNGAWLSAYKISQNANPDLKWEQTSMLNIGVDFSVLNNRLGGRVEWYNKKTSDMLYDYPVPTPPYLYSYMMANVGDMENKGVEVSLNLNAIRTKDFSWDVTLNLAHNKNKITKLSNDVYTMDKILAGNFFIRGGSSTTHVIEVGCPVGQFYGLVCNGIDENGRYIFVDQNDDGEITDPADFDYIGNAQPKLTYGLSNAFRYKKIDFSFFVRGTLGNDVLNMSRISYAQSGFLPGTNALDDPLTYTLTETPRYSSYYLEKGSFLRLDNMSLGYSFDTWNGIRLYATAQNLFVITKYKGLDPEVTVNGSEGLAPGVEPREFYPKARTFSIGMSINF